MAKHILTRVGSRGHHTFTLTVEDTLKSINATGTEAIICLAYTLTLYGGSWDFHWNSRKVHWGISIANKYFYGAFGHYDKNTTLTITSGIVEIKQTTNGAMTQWIDLGVTDEIDQSYSPGNVDWKSEQMTLNYYTLYTSSIASRITEISDEGNNTFKLAGVVGNNGDQNNIYGIQIFQKFNDSNVSYDNIPSSLIKEDTNIKAGDTFEYYFPILLENTTDGKADISAIVYNLDVHNTNPGSGVTTLPGAKYYSAPGVPTNTKIISEYKDNQTAHITFQASIGKSGYNNDATGIEMQYRIPNNPDKQAWQTLSVSQIDGTTTFKSQCEVGINDIQDIYVQARTIGNVDPGKKVYIDGNEVNIRYSPWAEFNSLNIPVTPPTKPKNLTIKDNGDNTFSISCKIGESGNNNAAIGYEIFYTVDNTWPTNIDKAIKYNGGNIFISGKDTTIYAMARTVGAHDNYKYSDFAKAKTEPPILYYKTPQIQIPTIITTDNKKLTKKSEIEVKANIQLYHNTFFKKYTIQLYKYINDELTNKKKLIEISNSITEDIGQKIDNDQSREISGTFSLKGTSIKKDDQIYAKIEYEVWNGKKENLVNNINTPMSYGYLIESSGVMRTKIGNMWYEGQVWTNIDGNWKEASDVYLNVNNQWKESV